MTIKLIEVRNRCVGLSPKSVSVGTESIELFEESQLRSLLVIQNEGNMDIWLGFGFPAEVGKGVRVEKSGGVFRMELVQCITSVNAISSSGSNDVMTQEFLSPSN